MELQDYEAAETQLRKALELRRQLYPSDSYPNGHIEIIESLVNSSRVRTEQGKYVDALTHAQDAVRMSRALGSEGSDLDSQQSVARALLNLGSISLLSGDTRSARAQFEEVAEICRALVTKRKTIVDRQNLAPALTGLGRVCSLEDQCAVAVEYLEEALSVYRDLFGGSGFSFSTGQSELADCLDYLAVVSIRLNRYAYARRCYEEAAAIRNVIYSPDRCPNGHPSLASGLQNLAEFYANQGEFGRARQVYEQSLKIWRQLFPTEKFPKGHPSTAKCCVGLADDLIKLGDYARAEELLLEAMSTLSALHGAANREMDHRDMVACFESLLALRACAGRYKEAEELCLNALEMSKRLFPSRDYADGHWTVAALLNDFGTLRQLQGEYESAHRYFQDAVAMNRRLYPPDSYKKGHPVLARSIGEFAVNLWLEGNAAGAIETIEESLVMWQQFVDDFCATASEAESLNLLMRLPPNLGLLISLWQRTDRPASELYNHVWHYRGSLARGVARRQRSSHEELDSDVADLFATLIRTRQELSGLAFARAATDPAHLNRRRSRLKELVAEKERIERALADASPELLRDVSLPSYRDLSEKLPIGAVFVDLCRYGHFEHHDAAPKSAGVRSTPNYVAFVISKDCPLDLVLLGPAEPIDVATYAWRRSIVENQVSDAPTRLRHLLWEPIERVLPATTTTAYLAVEGPLTAIPWSALPGKDSGTVLLEQYVLALVPYGPFLLDRLAPTPQEAASSDNDTLLAVGGAAYDQQPNVLADENQLATMRAAAATDGRTVQWADLPGTLDEIQYLREIVGRRRAMILTGRDATTERVFGELPKARWAVFATHGFFADSKVRSSMQLDQGAFEERELVFEGELTSPAGRSPLLLSGLVFAGANLPRQQDDFGIPQGDGGILTAEAIASLPLENLELAVLSACDTGLGEVAGGEGVFGLQRAFHQAGAANVVASLWKLDDRATAALMRLFYFKVFRENKSPLVALREAQLAIYHNPDQIGSLASARAPEFGKAVKLVDGAQPTTANGKAATRLWAGFVLSGSGR